jgi:hypothetical protein
MAIVINGSGTVTGISAGGLPDASVLTADIADANITADKLSGAQTGAAPIYGCRAWVNFDGTRNEADTGASTNGANVKIRASGNVTSVLKNGTGDYTITFTTAMPDTNYAPTFGGFNTGNGDGSWIVAGTGSGAYPAGITTGSLRILTYSYTGNTQDQQAVFVHIFR